LADYAEEFGRKARHPFGTDGERAPDPLLNASLPEGDEQKDPLVSLWNNLQQRIGNERLGTILSERLSNPGDLYIRHLIEIARESGLDVSPHLPWNARPSWIASLHPYLEVLSAEATREDQQTVLPLSRDEAHREAWRINSVSTSDAVSRTMVDRVHSRLPAAETPPPDRVVRQAVGGLLTMRATDTLDALDLRVRESTTAATDRQDDLDYLSTLQNHVASIEDIGSDASLAWLSNWAGTPTVESMDTLGRFTTPYPSFGETAVEMLAGAQSAGMDGSDQGASTGADAVMRRGQGAPNPEHPSVDQALRNRGGGQQLPSNVRAELESRFGADFEAVRIHTDSVAADAARALRANAFTVGQDIFFAQGQFSPEAGTGRHLLVHELAHVVQEQQGRTAGMSGVSSPSDALEQEAEAFASTILRSESVAPQSTDAPATFDADSLVDVGQTSQDSLSAQAEVAEAGTPAMHREASGSGDDMITFALAGFSWTIPKPEAVAGQVCTQAIQAIPIPGLELSEAQIEFDEALEFKGGIVTGDLVLGQYVQMQGLSLAVDRNGNVSTSLEGASITVTDILSGVIDLRITQDGISGEVEFGYEQLAMQPGFTLNNGTITVAVDTEGQVTGQGTLGGAVTGIGSFTLQAQLENETLGGALSIELDTVQLGTWGRLEAGAFEGVYDEVEGSRVSGNVTMTARDFVQADISATYTHPPDSADAGQAEANTDFANDTSAADALGTGDQGASAGQGGQDAGAASTVDSGAGMSGTTTDQTSAIAAQGTDPGQDLGQDLGEGEAVTLPGPGTWDMQVTLTQMTDYQRGEFSVSDANATFEVTQNAVGPIAFGAGFNWRQFEGSVGGTYDIGGQHVTGEGEVSLTEPMPLPMGVTLNTATGLVEIEKNALKKVTGNFEAVVPFQGEDTFNALGEEVSYNFEEQAFAGDITVSLMRDLIFGSEDATHLKISEQAQAVGTAGPNGIEQITGGIPFSVLDTEGEIGSGGVGFDFSSGEEGMTAEGTFALTRDFGIPARAEGPLMLEEGGSFRLTMEGSQLETAEIQELNFHLQNPVADGQGRVDGSVAGTYHFPESALTANASATIAEEWIFNPTWGEFALCEGGTVNASIEPGLSPAVDLNVDFRADIASEIPVKLIGNINGEMNPETGTTTGEISGALAEDVEIPFSGGDQLTLIAEETSAKAELGEAGLETVTFGLGALYTDPTGVELLHGQIEDGLYNVAEGQLSFNGSLTLLEQVERRTEDGKWGAVILPESNVDIGVAGNNLERLGGDLFFEIHDEAPLLQGSLTNAEITSPDWKFSGDFDVRLMRNIQFPKDGAAEGQNPLLQLEVEEQSGLDGRIEENNLQTVHAALNFLANLEGDELARGFFDGTMDMEAEEFSGSGSFGLTRDLVLSTNPGEGERMSGWTLVIPEGGNISAEFGANKLQHGQVNVAAMLFQGSECVALGAIDGQYQLGDEAGYNGSANFTVISPIDWAEDDRFAYSIQPGTFASATMAQGSVTQAEANFILYATEAGTDKVMLTLGAQYQEGSPLNGEAGVAVLDDILVYSGDENELFLEEGSGGKAQITEDNLQNVGGEISLRLDRSSQPLLRGVFGANYEVADGENAQVSAKGSIELLNPIGFTKDTWGFTIEEAQGEAELLESDFKYIDGQMAATLDESGRVFAEIEASGKYEEESGTPVGFSAQGGITFIDELDTGVTFQDYDLVLMPGTGATFDIQNGDLQTLSSIISMEIRDTNGPLVGVELGGTYDHPGRTFTGSGQAELLQRVEVATVPVGDEQYTFWLEPATTINAQVDGNRLSEVGGTLIGSVWDGNGEFLRATAEGRYQKLDSGDLLSINGSVAITREKEMVTAGEYKVSLIPGSGATVDVFENDFVGMGGTIQTRVDKDGTPFATIGLAGTYTPSTGFNGIGEAVLVDDFHIAKMSIFDLWLNKGAGGRIELANSEPVFVTGAVPIGLDKNGELFIEGNLNGTLDIKQKHFSGNGSATVVQEQQLATFGTQSLWLKKGSGATVDVQNNQLQSIGGNVKLSLRDPKEYILVYFGGRFDAVGGTGFTGDGGATVIREKKLGQVGDYSFWLHPGAGAEAKVVENALTEVGGVVPFEVHDKEGTLLRGRAEGKYLAETELFSGEGDVKLARDVDFNLGGGTKITIEKGSGGDASVKENKLERLGGTLKATLSTTEGPLLRMEAEGEFDAVEKRLVYAEGTVTVLRPIEPLGPGIVVIENLSASARLENNELKWAEGDGNIKIPPLNITEGTFHLRWENHGDEDKYSGSGSVNFTIIEDNGDGRSMSGMIEAAYNSSGALHLGGEVDYQINEKIGGKLGASVDIGEGEQKPDPAMTGSLEVDVDLIEARNLFQLEIPIIQPDLTVSVYGVDVLFAGAAAGMGVDMHALHLNTTIALQGAWHPLGADAGTVPPFSIVPTLTWGLDFNAWVAAWMKAGLGVKIAELSIGVKGSVDAGVELGSAISGTLESDGEEFGASLSIGLSVTPSITLSMAPIYTAKVGIGDATLGPENEELAEPFEMPIGDFIGWEWATTYHYGDVDRPPESAPVTETSDGGASADTSTMLEEKPAAPAPQSAPATETDGGPTLDSGEDIAGKDGAEGGGQESELADTMEKAEILAKGLAAIAFFVDMAMTLIPLLLMGPAGWAIAVLVVIWKIITGAWTWDKISTAFTDMIAALEVAWEMLSQFLPDPIKQAADFFNDEPDLLGALFDFSADDKVRASVYNGDHLSDECKPEVKGRMVNAMREGACMDADEQCINKVLRSCGGDIHTVISEGGGAQDLWDAMNGAECRELERIYNANGVHYSSGVVATVSSFIPW